jgi:hypothetical protein
MCKDNAKQAIAAIRPCTDNKCLSMHKHAGLLRICLQAKQFCRAPAMNRLNFAEDYSGKAPEACEYTPPSAPSRKANHCAKKYIVKSFLTSKTAAKPQATHLQGSVIRT